MAWILPFPFLSPLPFFSCLCPLAWKPAGLLTSLNDSDWYFDSWKSCQKYSVFAPKDTAQAHGDWVQVLPTGHLHEVMSQSDYIVAALPETPGTLELIDAAAIGAMQRRAVFINIGRGTTVNEPALSAGIEKPPSFACRINLPFIVPSVGTRVSSLSAAWHMRGVPIGVLFWLNPPCDMSFCSLLSLAWHNRGAPTRTLG